MENNDLKFIVTIPVEILEEKNMNVVTEKRYYYRPYEGCWEKEISRTEDASVVEFPVKNGVPLSKLIKKVIEELTPVEWDIVVKRLIYEWSLNGDRHSYAVDFNKQEWQSIVLRLWTMKGYNFDTMFDITYGFKGIGYMGGTGVGTNVHHLTLDIVTGVKVKTEPFKTLGAIWISARTGELLDVRQKAVHLREQIAEADVYCVLSAHPDCQQTVKYQTALGYPVKSFTAKNITCLNCDSTVDKVKVKYVSKVSSDRKYFKELVSKFQDAVIPYCEQTYGWSGNPKGCSKQLFAQVEGAQGNYNKDAVYVYLFDVKQAKAVIRKYGARKVEAEFDLTKQYDEALAYIKTRHEKLLVVK
jgi:hypothetical protein